MGKRAFRINIRNIQQTIGILVTFISEIKLQKIYILGKYDCLSVGLCVHFEPLLGWEYAYICHNLRTEEEEGIYSR